MEEMRKLKKPSLVPVVAFLAGCLAATLLYQRFVRR